MKKKRNLFLGVVLGILICNALAFFFLPFITKHFSFLLGFIAGFVFFSLAWLIFLFYNKKSSPKNNNFPLAWILTFSLISLGGVTSGYFVYKQKESFRAKTAFQQQQIAHKSQMIASVRNSSLVYLMSNLFNKIDSELKSSPRRALSDESIARVIALSHFFKPYQSIQEDSLSEKKLSPERGQLLITLYKMNIDSSSFKEIKKKTSFSGADLRETDLKGLDLRGVNLSGANLMGADLRNADLAHANLEEVNMWGANMIKINLKNANLNKANLAWSDLTEADLRKAMLDGVDLTAAKLRKADLSNVQMEWADLSSAFLNEANLTGAKMLGTFLRRANLTKANCTDAKFILVKLEDVDLTMANMSGTNLRKAGFKEKNWFKKLNEWQVTGAKEIQEKYKIAADVSGVSNYRLVNAN